MTVAIRHPLANLIEAHRAAHEAYVAHLKLDCCSGHPLCSTGQALLDAADDAGKRWDWTERRMSPR